MDDCDGTPLCQIKQIAEKFNNWQMIRLHNQNSNEIVSFYGIRVRSRMREIFNLINFDMTAKVKRF
jgi:hypothetical protein